MVGIERRTGDTLRIGAVLPPHRASLAEGDSMSTHRSAIPKPPDDCAACPALTVTRKKPVQSRGPDNAEVVVVGQAPGSQENDCGAPFVGRSGELLETLLRHVAKIDPENVRFTNVVRCYPGKNKDGKGDREPNSKECRTCKEKWLLPELRGLKNAKLVITLGGVALKALTGRENLECNHGISIPPENASYTVFPTYHPSAPTAPGQFYIICEIIKDFAQLAERQGGE